MDWKIIPTPCSSENVVTWLKGCHGHQFLLRPEHVVDFSDRVIEGLVRRRVGTTCVFFSVPTFDTAGLETVLATSRERAEALVRALAGGYLGRVAIDCALQLIDAVSHLLWSLDHLDGRLFMLWQDHPVNGALSARMPHRNHHQAYAQRADRPHAH